MQVLDPRTGRALGPVPTAAPTLQVSAVQQVDPVTGAAIMGASALAATGMEAMALFTVNPVTGARVAPVAPPMRALYLPAPGALPVGGLPSQKLQPFPPREISTRYWVELVPEYGAVLFKGKKPEQIQYLLGGAFAIDVEVSGSVLEGGPSRTFEALGAFNAYGTVTDEGGGQVRFDGQVTGGLGSLLQARTISIRLYPGEEGTASMFGGFTMGLSDGSSFNGAAVVRRLTSKPDFPSSLPLLSLPLSLAGPAGAATTPTNFGVFMPSDLDKPHAGFDFEFGKFVQLCPAGCSLSIRELQPTPSSLLAGAVQISAPCDGRVVGIIKRFFMGSPAVEVMIQAARDMHIMLSFEPNFYGKYFEYDGTPPPSNQLPSVAKWAEPGQPDCYVDNFDWATGLRDSVGIGQWNAIVASVGDVVSRGGLLGHLLLPSGRYHQTPPTHHFGVYVNGTPVCPLKWLNVPALTALKTWVTGKYNPTHPVCEVEYASFHPGQWLG